MKKGCGETHPLGNVSLQRLGKAQLCPSRWYPTDFERNWTWPSHCDIMEAVCKVGGPVLVQSGHDIWIPLGCISSAHIENYIPQQWDEVAILNGRRSIYNDFVDIFTGQ